MKYAIVLVVVFCTGCATIMTGGGPTQSVRFTSQPHGASVYVDDNFIGKTPVAAELTRKDDHMVRMELDQDSRDIVIKHGANLWVFGNILFGGIIGLVVDLCTGSLDGALSPNDVKCTFAPPAPAQ